MIRRWSHINTINIDVSLNFLLVKKYNKINVFKNSVNFKRFTFKRTKFKRKSLTRVSHISKFLIYTNVFKFWSKNYLMNKHLSKNQYLYNIFLKNIFFYNFNFIKNKNENIFYNFNFVFSTWIKKSYFYHFKKNALTPIFCKNNNITTAWYSNSINVNNQIVPAYTHFDSNLFSHTIFDKKYLYDFNEFFFILYSIQIQKYVELYKLILLNFFIFK